MNYEQAIDYIEQTDTPRQRYGLEKLKQALHLMGDPQEKVPYVHIAGTNGKGSTASMLSSVLNRAVCAADCTPPRICSGTTSGFKSQENRFQMSR